MTKSGMTVLFTSNQAGTFEGSWYVIIMMNRYMYPQGKNLHYVNYCNLWLINPIVRTATVAVGSESVHTNSLKYVSRADKHRFTHVYKDYLYFVDFTPAIIPYILCRNILLLMLGLQI